MIKYFTHKKRSCSVALPICSSCLKKENCESENYIALHKIIEVCNMIDSDAISLNITIDCDRFKHMEDC